VLFFVGFVGGREACMMGGGSAGGWVGGRGGVRVGEREAKGGVGGREDGVGLVSGGGGRCGAGGGGGGGGFVFFFWFFFFLFVSLFFFCSFFVFFFFFFFVLRRVLFPGNQVERKDILSCRVAGKKASCRLLMATFHAVCGPTGRRRFARRSL